MSWIRVQSCTCCCTLPDSGISSWVRIEDRRKVGDWTDAQLKNKDPCLGCWVECHLESTLRIVIVLPVPGVPHIQVGLDV